MKKLLLTVCILVLAMPAHAQEKDARKLAAELLAITGVEASVKDISNQIYELSLKPVTEQLACKDPKIEEELRSGLNKLNLFGNLKEGFIGLYIEAFTADELAKILEFNKSRLGQKVLKVTPDLFAKGAKLGQDFAISKQPELVDIFKKVSTKYLTDTGQCKKPQTLKR